MADRCGAADGSRTERYRQQEDDPSPPASKKENEPTPHCQADADARRDAWIARSGAPAVPRSCGPTTAQKDAEAAANRSRDVHLAAAQQTKKADPKLADDPAGNAIPGLVAGGVGAAGSAVSTGAKVTTALAKHVVEHAAAEAIQHVVAEAAHVAAGVGATLPASTPPGEKPSSAAPAAGRSGARGVSEAPTDALDGGKSEPQPPAGRDAIPYRPGKVPVRIPEALPPTMTIRG